MKDLFAAEAKNAAFGRIESIWKPCLGSRWMEGLFSESV
jgi:hypothetical protein